LGKINYIRCIQYYVFLAETWAIEAWRAVIHFLIVDGSIGIGFFPRGIPTGQKQRFPGKIGEEHKIEGYYRQSCFMDEAVTDEVCVWISSPRPGEVDHGVAQLGKGIIGVIADLVVHPAEYEYDVGQVRRVHQPIILAEGDRGLIKLIRPCPAPSPAPCFYGCFQETLSPSSASRFGTHTARLAATVQECFI